MIHVWFEKFSVSALIWCLIRHGGSNTTVLANSCTLGADRLLAWFRTLGITVPVIRIVTPQLADIDEHGRALVVEFEHRLAKIAEWASAEWTVDNRWLPPKYRADISTWDRILRAHLMSVSYDTVVYATYAANQYRTKRPGFDKAKAAFVYITPPALPGLVRQFLVYETPTVLRTCVWPNLRMVISALQVLPYHPRYWFRRFRTSLLSPNQRPAHEVSAEAIRNGVVFQQNIVRGFERYPTAGHMDWLADADVTSERIVFCFNRPDSPCDEQTRAELKKHGFGWLDALEVTDYFDHPLWDTIRILFSTWRAFPGLHRRFRFWHWASFSQHLVLMEGYRRLFRHYNVLALRQSWIFEPSTIAMIFALQKEGGAHFWTFWSVHHFMTAKHHMGTADAIFAWGDYHLGFYRAHGFQHSHVFKTGVSLADGNGIDDEHEIRTIKSKLPPQRELTLVAFDTSFGPNVHIAEREVDVFYDTVLDLLKDHPNWCALVKGKKRTNNFKNVEEYRALEAEGRLIVLSSLTRPSVAARCADLAVCASLNSAGFISGLWGTPCVHLDLTNLFISPIATHDTDHRVVFNTPAALKTAIEEFAANRESRIGDIGFWADALDPFRDGKGRHRCSAILSKYVAARDRGLSRNDALDGVARWYSAEYGHDKVSTPDQTDTTDGIRWWKDVSTRTEAVYNLEKLRRGNDA